MRRDRDRRKVELELTDAGRKTVESLIPLVVDKLNLALADFSRDEVTELKRLLIKLNTRLEATLDIKASAGDGSVRLPCVSRLGYSSAPPSSQDA